MQQGIPAVSRVNRPKGRKHRAARRNTRKTKKQNQRQRKQRSTAAWKANVGTTEPLKNDISKISVQNALDSCLKMERKTKHSNVFKTAHGPPDRNKCIIHRRTSSIFVCKQHRCMIHRRDLKSIIFVCNHHTYRARGVLHCSSKQP